ncbi:MAG TPA: ATP-binding protein [Synergistales bacterium]|nr:ATP-binding protein [Synergistales bacterium]
MFTDRLEELAFLAREYERPSSFVVIYGRRRTGKTTLIEQFIRGKNALYFLANEEPEVFQRRRFQALLRSITNDPLLEDKRDPLSWENLLRLFARQEGKKILVMDEFQYLATVYKPFPSILQSAWDQFLKDSECMVILCGSLISLMEGTVLSYASPLYGRRTGQLLLKGLPFSCLEDFSPGSSVEKQIQLYSITGGIPKYLEEASRYDSVFEMIEKGILDKNAYLFREPDFLLDREAGAAGTYKSILAQISSGKKKIGEIASAFQVHPSHLTRYLKVLRDLGLVERVVPVTEPAPERAKNGIYRIRDPFLAFWFRYVSPHIDSLEIRETGPAMEKIRASFETDLVPRVYEDLCRQSVPRLYSSGEIPFLPVKVGSWWNRADEIDVVGLGEDGILSGECKYQNRPVGEDVLRDLERKTEKMLAAEGLRTGKVFYVLFSRKGFTKGLTRKVETRKDLCLVDLLP